MLGVSLFISCKNKIQCVCVEKKIFFFKIFKNLFTFGCIGSSLPHMGYLQLRRVGTTLHCSAQASHCSGFSCCRAWTLGAWASVVVACGLSSCGSWALECRLSSCGAWTQLLCVMWDRPRPGLKPVSPALAGGFLTTVSPGKSRNKKILKAARVGEKSTFHIKEQ